MTRARKRPRGFGCVYQRGNRWWIRTPAGKYESAGDTRKDAEALLEKRLLDARSPKPDVGNATYEDLEAILLDDLKTNGRRSIDNVEFRLSHLRRFFGGMRAADVSYAVVNAYLARRMDAARPATVLYELKLLKRMFRLAHRADRVGYLPAFPTVSVGDNARKGFCAPEDFERLIGFLPDHAAPIVATLYMTGWRTREVLGLTWARVDFDAGELRLDASESKSGKARRFPFNGLPELAAILRAQREATSILERERGQIIPSVFHLDGQAIRSFRSGWRAAVRKAGLPGLRPHDLRRSSARNLVRAGVPEGVVMKLCGWRTRSMFDRYNVADDRDLREGVERLSGFLSSRRSKRAAK